MDITTVDVTMGSFDGAELYELIGLYILYTLAKKYGYNNSRRHNG